MWKAAAGQSVSVAVNEDGDDWETDPDFENDVSETEQRWGAKTVEGSGHQEHIDIHKLRDTVSTEHTSLKKKELDKMPKASHGYGGKFGVQQDRMDKSAVGHDYQSKLSKHCSQTDTSKGFGGKFGVQADRVDQSAVGFEYAGKTEKHASQRDYTKGFGGKFGVETDKVDKSAMGFEYQGKTERHESQKDYVKGFGGKFGVQTDRQDASALGWDHQEKLQLHESQKDYSKGFGGKFGVQNDRMDKSAGTFEDVVKPAPAYQKTKPVEAAGSSTGSIKARFENIAKQKEEEDRKRAEEERVRRQAKEKQEQEEARRKMEETAKAPSPVPAPSPSPSPSPAPPLQAAAAPAYQKYSRRVPRGRRGERRAAVRGGAADPRRRARGPVPDPRGHGRASRRPAGRVRRGPGADGRGPVRLPSSRRRRDFLRPRRHHHQHRDDRRGLVAGRVQRRLRPVPRQLRGGSAMRTPRPRPPKKERKWRPETIWNPPFFPLWVFSLITSCS
ncbi:src substrate cortactin isoform X5 [Etheostoma spectabile]|uniref:src substrate cortactin isoform X5 n=1 Tax=Etheostoma spectabile TaxID=54343 RepID=UPI0013AFEA60|nr:src substrate cortactin isoform X5 [Etheostoma spectabile]